MLCVYFKISKHCLLLLLICSVSLRLKEPYMKIVCVTVSCLTTSLYNRVFPSIGLQVCLRVATQTDGLTHIEIVRSWRWARTRKREWEWKHTHTHTENEETDFALIMCVRRRRDVCLLLCLMNNHYRSESSLIFQNLALFWSQHDGCVCAECVCVCVLPESRAALTLPPVSSGERKGKLILRRGESVRPRDRTLKSEVQPNIRGLKRVKSV